MPYPLNYSGARFFLLEFKITQFPGGFRLNTFGGGLVSGGAFNWMYFLLTVRWACNSLGGS